MQDDKIIEYIQGKLIQDHEITEILSWIEASEDNQQRYNELKKIWVMTGLNTVKEVASTKFFSEEKFPPLLKLKYVNHWFKYASIIIITLILGGMGGYLYHNQSGGEQGNAVFAFSSGDQSNSQVTLPDGSVIDLNAKTKLTYQLDKKRNRRLVSLSGEACFNVVHNEKLPFVLDFGSLEVVDVGTVFNVKANEKTDYIETTLIEGLVDLVVNKTEVVNLVPGQKGVYSKKNHEINVTIADQQGITGWKSNRFVFEDECFEKVITELCAWYDVDVQWSNEGIKGERLHYIVQRSIEMETALELLKLSIPYKYRIITKDNEIEKIVIY